MLSVSLSLIYSQLWIAVHRLHFHTVSATSTQHCSDPQQHTPVFLATHLVSLAFPHVVALVTGHRQTSHVLVRMVSPSLCLASVAHSHNSKIKPNIKVSFVCCQYSTLTLRLSMLISVMSTFMVALLTILVLGLLGREADGRSTKSVSVPVHYWYWSVTTGIPELLRMALIPKFMEAD